jgi:hypothetical protein
MIPDSARLTVVTTLRGVDAHQWLYLLAAAAMGMPFVLSRWGLDNVGADEGWSVEAWKNVWLRLSRLKTYQRLFLLAWAAVAVPAILLLLVLSVERWMKLMSWP